MSFKAIIFDMDGLMIDSERLYIDSELEIANSYGKTLEDSTIAKMMGRKPIHSMTIFAEDLGLDVDPATLLARRDELMLAKYSGELPVMKGLYEIIDRFSGTLTYGIATGTQKKFLDIVLRSLQMEGVFSVLQTSDNVKNGKPAPDIYLETCSKLGFAPENCIVLEDSSNGARAGTDAGCYVIAVPNEFTLNQDFSFTGFVAPDLIAAGEHIKGLL